MAKKPSALSQRFSRSTVADLGYLARRLANKRCYTTSSRGEEVAREFEEWIKAIPEKTEIVRAEISPHKQDSEAI